MPDGDAQPSLIPQHAGEQLRAAREAQKLDLAEIAARTRIPQRHLEAIEAGNYSALPSTTYATGFARAYAKAVGIDDIALVQQVRGELTRTWDRPAPVPYEIDDPARAPTPGIVWVGILVALLAVVFAGLFFGTNIFRGGSSGGEEPTAVVATTDEPAATLPVPPPAAAGGGQVSLTASDTVWIRVYDAAGTTIIERTLAKGERYDVPADANNPMINTGRPDLLAVTVNGSAVPPLATGVVSIKDVPIGADALLARGATPASTPTSAPTSTPSPAAAAPTPRTSPSPRPTARATSMPRPTSTPRPAGTPESLLPPSATTEPR